MYVVHTFVCRHITPMHAGAREEHEVSCSITLCLIPLRQGSSLILELGKWPASPGDPATSFPTYTHTALDLQVHMRFFKAFVCGCFDPNSGPHTCTASTLTVRHLSSPQSFLFYYFSNVPSFYITRNKQIALVSYLEKCVKIICHCFKRNAYIQHT